MPLPYYILDVFTDTPYAGNPLAVVMDGDGVETARMQAIAREFNLSETVFVQKSENPGHRARLRIFTPTRELPFAGHPTVGTGALLATLDAEVDGEDDRLIVVEEGVGPVRIGVRLGEAAPYAEFDIPKLPVRVDMKEDRSAMSSAIGLMPNELNFDNHRPSIFNAGLDFTYLPVRDEAALARANPVAALCKTAFGNGAALYLYTRHGKGFAARMFDPAAGIPEDPATGSAAAGFTGVVHRFDAMKDGLNRITVLQGREMGRPSRIDLEITLSAGELKAVRVGGHAVVVARGELL